MLAFSALFLFHVIKGHVTRRPSDLSTFFLYARTSFLVNIPEERRQDWAELSLAVGYLG